MKSSQMRKTQSEQWWMSSIGNEQQFKWSGVLVFLAILAALPGIAQPANFDNLELGENKTSGILTGSTGGSTSLPAIVSNRDRHNQKCLGFGDPTPDHILILKQNFSRLRLKVDSDGADTTLVIQGADGTVRCGDESKGSQDASITDTDWQAGTYKIWVGSGVPGVRKNYTLSIRQ
jgi:hypothetical protein